MATFLDKLRINDIFPQGEGIYKDRLPFGLPDFEGGYDPGPRERTPSRNTAVRKMPSRQTPQFGGKTASQIRLDKRLNPEKMNVEYKDSYIGGAGSRIMERSDERAAARNDPRFEQEIELAQIKEGGRQRDLDIKQQRANVYEFRAKNPNLRIVAPKGGDIIAVNPQTGEQVANLGPTGTLSDQERLELTGEQRMEQIGAQGANQQAVQGMRGEQQRGIQELRGRQQLAGIGAREEGIRGRPAPPMSATQSKVQQVLNARQAIGTNPGLADFIEFNPDGTISIKGNPDQATMQQINSQIYGQQPVDIELPAQNTPVQPTTTTPRGTTNVTVPQSKYKVTVR